MSVEVGYTRRWLQELHGHRQPGAWRPRTSTSSASRRRPIRGCRAAAATPCRGLYNVKPAHFSAAPNNLRTYAPDYGEISQVYNGVDININARMRNGVQLQAGTSTGQRVTDYCDVRGKLPEQTGGFSTGSEVPAYSPVNPYCHVEPGITTRFTGAGSYIVPKIDVQLAATFQSSPAEPLRADWTVSSADRGADAGPAARGQRAERHGEPAGAGPDARRRA